MKKFILVLISLTFLLAPVVVSAEETTTCVQTTVYGGGVGVVCGVKTHKTVPTALGDNLVLISLALLTVSGGLYLVSKRLKTAKV